MIRIPTAAPAALLGLVLVYSARVPARCEDRPVVRLLPEKALIALEVARPEAILDPLLRDATVRALTAHPVWEGIQKDAGFRALAGAVAYLEAQLDTDWRSAVKTLLGGGIAVAVTPEGKSVLIVEAREEKLLRQVHDHVVRFAQARATQKGGGNEGLPETYRGVKIWSAGPRGWHALVGRRFVFANDRGALEATLDRSLGEGGADLGSNEAYRRALQVAGHDAAATVFVNLGELKKNPAIREGLSRQADPMGSLLVAGAKAALDNGTWVAAALGVGDGAVELRVTTDGKSSTYQPAALTLPTKPGDGALPNLEVPRAIAGLSLYRDLHEFYAAKDDLFPERTAGLIFFENMMGIFFSGLDLTDEVFAELYPDMRVVVAEQEYDAAIGTPEVQLPGFALVLHMRNPEKFSEVIEEAWQKALGLINFTRGQQALPGLIMDRVPYRGEKLTVSYYRPPTGEASGTVDARYNVRPTLARTGSYLIFSSTDGLARDIMDALAEGDSPPRAIDGADTILEIDSGALLSILRRNKEHLVRNNMLEKGHSEEKARAEVGTLLAAAELVSSLKLRLGTIDERPEAVLRLGVRLPEPSKNAAKEAPEDASPADGGAGDDR